MLKSIVIANGIIANQCQSKNKMGRSSTVMGNCIVVLSIKCETFIQNLCLDHFKKSIFELNISCYATFLYLVYT